MPDQYSVISNQNLRGALRASAPARGVEVGDARSLLRGRQLFVLGEEVIDASPWVSASASGIVTTGAYGVRQARQLKDAHPEHALIIEPTRIEGEFGYWANPEQPFYLGDPNMMIRPTLDEALTEMRAAHSTIAITPTGQFKVGDSDSLKTALSMVNDVDRTDTAFLIPISGAVLDREDTVRQLIAVINRSKHPVLLALTSDKNPVHNERRRRAYRRIFEEATNMVIPWRVDLSGFDALAHGAVGMAVGVIPSKRRLTPVGRKGGSAADPSDMAPHMFIGDLLRFVRSTELRRHWFVDVESIACLCAICENQPIDRLFHSDEDRLTGHLHNALDLQRLHDQTFGLSPTEIGAWWAAQAAAALDAYAQLESYLGRAVPIPDEVMFWSQR
jgi:hypothetical protein